MLSHPTSRASTACVSSPKDWAVSTSSHMQQDADMCKAPPHLSALFPQLEKVHSRNLDRTNHYNFPFDNGTSRCVWRRVFSAPPGAKAGFMTRFSLTVAPHKRHFTNRATVKKKRSNLRNTRTKTKCFQVIRLLMLFAMKIFQYFVVRRSHRDDRFVVLVVARLHIVILGLNFQDFVEV